MAEKAGVTDGYIDKIEIGLQEPSDKALLKLASFLKFDRSELPPVSVNGELLAEIAMFEEQRGNFDRQFTKLHPKLKSLLLNIAPIVKNYL